MPSKSATIRDVARLAGVSESTVSRVLTEAETPVSISRETRQRVLAAAEELAYQPHPFARALRGKGTNLLGVIIREIDDPFFAQLIEVIGNEAKEKGYDLMLGYAKSDPAEALALSEILDLRHSDGLLLLGDLKESPQDQTFLNKIAQHTQIVSVCRGNLELPGSMPSVAVDNRKGALMAMEYLYGLGHQRIACLAAGRVGDFLQRIDAYWEFMRSRFGEIRKEYLLEEENSYEGGARATRRVLSLGSPPTAIFAADDTMAIGALSAAQDLGYAVPGDVSIIGFDDIPEANYFDPPLTTIRQNFNAMGRQSVEYLVQLINEPDTPLHQRVLYPELILRQSTLPPIR